MEPVRGGPTSNFRGEAGPPLSDSVGVGRRQEVSRLEETKPGRAVMPSFRGERKKEEILNARPNIIVVDDEPTALASLLDALTAATAGTTASSRICPRSAR